MLYKKGELFRRCPNLILYGNNYWLTLVNLC